MRRAMYVIGIAFIILLPSEIAVAAPQQEWTRRFAGSAIAVDASSAGLTAVAGSRWAPGGHQAMFVAVYGPRGGQRWQAAWRRAGGSAYASAVAVAPDGTIHVGGSRSGAVEYGESWWWLRRYAANGNLMWHRDRAAGPTSEDMGLDQRHLGPRRRRHRGRRRHRLL